MKQVFRSTRVVTQDGVGPATIVVDGERIVSVADWAAVPGEAILHDLGDLVLMPGLVDTHVHINEPGRTEWEGFLTATKAAAAGGVTTLVDMPLNCVPEVISAEALAAKRSAAHGKTWVDWAAWGGVVRGNADRLQELERDGVPGYKCFLIDSGVEGFAWVDESDLRGAMQRLRGTGLPLLAHAEAPRPVQAATALLTGNVDWRSYATYLRSRPDEAEIEAISLLIALAEEFQVHVHIVHLASARALPLLMAARNRGTPITVETCPHYLWFAAEEIPDGATEYKCAPPIRSNENREQLWNALIDGVIDMVATDHSPCPPEMKGREAGLWNRAWGGIAGLGLALPVVWTGLAQRGFANDTGLARASRWLSAFPAKLAGMSEDKGALRVGCDADFVVFDPNATWTVGQNDLHFRHKLSPYLGAQLHGRVTETWLRGRRIFSNHCFEGTPSGREWVRR